jgi:hypothetical protein
MLIWNISLSTSSLYRLRIVTSVTCAISAISLCVFVHLSKPMQHSLQLQQCLLVPLPEVNFSSLADAKNFVGDFFHFALHSQLVAEFCYVLAWS